MEEGKETDLFRSITEGNLTEEQWNTFRSRQKVNRHFVATNYEDDDEEDEDEEEEEEEDSESEEEPYERLQLGEMTLESDEEEEDEIEEEEAEGGGQEEELHEKEEKDTQESTEQLTKKYLNGELSFTQFTDLVERNKTSEDLDEVTSEEEIDDDDEDYVPESAKKTTTKKKKKKIREQVEEDQEKRKKRDRTWQIPEDGDESAEVEKTKKRERRHNRLPKDLQGLIGEANVRFAQGDHQGAIQICLQVITLAPLSPEPFQTLRMFYEEIGDKEKFLQFSLICAHLSPNDVEEWIGLAEMSLECNDLRQAVTCYGRAIRCEPNNLDLMWTRSNLYERLGETKKLIEQLGQILNGLKSEDGELYFRVVRKLTQVLHDDNQVERATDVMNEAFDKYDAWINVEDINFLLELLMKRRFYAKSIKVLCDNCEVSFEPDGSVSFTDDSSDFSSPLNRAQRCVVPKGVPIDLIVKLIVCLIRLESHSLAQDLLGLLLEENPEDMGDLYLDVAEAYMDMSLYDKATPLIATLVVTDKYNLGAVWLRYGECLGLLGRLEESVNAYFRVIDLAPTHLQARLALSGLLQQLGRSEEALGILKQDEEDADAQLEPQLLLQRCNLLYSHQVWNEYIRASKLLHSIHLNWPSNSSEMSDYSYSVKSHRFRAFVKNKDEEGSFIVKLDLDDSRFSDNGVSVGELWSHYQKYCKILFDLKRFDELELAGKASITSNLFIRDEDIIKECDFLRLLGCYFNRSSSHAYTLIKRQLWKDVNNNRLWNLFGRIVLTLPDLRYNRFCIRLMFKHQDHLALGLLNGHNALVSGSYKHALGEYMSIFKACPDDPLINLCIGLVFVHMTCQKFSGKKHSLAIQACAFLDRYVDLRGEGQETFYNFGRAMHQMGIVYVAEHYYLKALQYEPAVDDPKFDLRAEIAFNLSLIYQMSNAHDLANMYINKYCVV